MFSAYTLNDILWFWPTQRTKLDDSQMHGDLMEREPDLAGKEKTSSKLERLSFIEEGWCKSWLIFSWVYFQFQDRSGIKNRSIILCWILFLISRYFSKMALASACPLVCNKPVHLPARTNWFLDSLLISQLRTFLIFCYHEKRRRRD